VQNVLNIVDPNSADKSLSGNEAALADTSQQTYQVCLSQGYARPDIIEMTIPIIGIGNSSANAWTSLYALQAKRFNNLTSTQRQPRVRLGQSNSLQ
jgi:hypothetical protein